MHSTTIKDGFNRKIELSFDSHLTPFGGLVPALHHLEKIGFKKRLESKLAPTLPTPKATKRGNPYALFDMIWQRLSALIAGREDLNDHDDLGADAVFRAATGLERIASCSTLCRFENKITQETIDAGNEFLQEMYLSYGTRRKVIIIDVDNTPVELFGNQEGRKFNGHYKCNCYLPLIAFIDGFPVGVYNGTEDGRATMLRVFRPLVKKLQARMPGVVLLLRADAGFNNVQLIDMCEELGIYYLIGLPKNPKITKMLRELEPEFVETFNRCCDNCKVIRQLGEIEDYEAETWSGPRRVISRDVWNEKDDEWDPRFIQTNIPKEYDKKCGNLWEKTAKDLYDSLYCQRGTDEQFNQEFKVQAHGARASAHRFITNSYRMLLGALTQLALRMLRTNFFKKSSPWHGCTLRKFRAAFIAVPAIVRKLKTKLQITISPGSTPETDLKSFWRVLPT